MYKYHWLESLEHDGASLVFVLAELLPGEPDGFIGLPLVVKPESPRFRVYFARVGAFKTVPEMFSEVSESAERITPFLLRERSSAYMLEMRDQMEISQGIQFDALRHYVVCAENVITHVLAPRQPEISEDFRDGD